MECAERSRVDARPLDLDRVSRAASLASPCRCGRTRSPTAASLSCWIHPRSHATFDVGRCGYLDGPHAHAAALSITLALRGRPCSWILERPPTRWMRACATDFAARWDHNTVTIDDPRAGGPRGPFHWRGNASGRQHGSRSNEAFAWAEASTAPYLPLRHRRTMWRRRLARG